MAQSLASKRVTQAARSQLAPLGLKRRGRSRTWLDDHGWWIICVDFESPAFEQGSGLAVFVDFHWHRRDHLVHAVGGRVREQGRLLDQRGPDLTYYFESDDAFAEAAEALARRAADEVIAWRCAFRTLEDWRRYLVGRSRDGGFWESFDAAACAGLSGSLEQAHDLFDQVVRVSNGAAPEPEWQVAARRDAAQLRDLVVAKPRAFVDEMQRRARLRRARLKLPDVEL